MLWFRCWSPILTLAQVCFLQLCTITCSSTAGQSVFFDGAILYQFLSPVRMRFPSEMNQLNLAGEMMLVVGNGHEQDGSLSNCDDIKAFRINL